MALIIYIQLRTNIHRRKPLFNVLLKLLKNGAYFYYFNKVYQDCYQIVLFNLIHLLVRRFWFCKTDFREIIKYYYFVNLVL